MLTQTGTADMGKYVLHIEKGYTKEVEDAGGSTQEIVNRHLIDFGTAVSTTSEFSSTNKTMINIERTAHKGKIPKEIVMRMYERENELRTCKATQEEYSRHRLPFESDVTENLQKQLLKEFDLPGDDEDILDMWWTQRYYHHKDPEVMAVPLVVKYDITREGDLRKGSPAPNARLVTSSGENRMLHDFMKTDRPLVVLGGSYS